ncbi:MAG: glycosyltransferase family 2 protein [Flavobacteriales bacterium]
MPAYNAETYIAEAVRSVLGQSHTNWELVVVDDGSTDGTAKILSTFEDPRIRVLHQVNKGIGSARNLALDHVKGELLAFLDADDILPADSLLARVKLLHDRPEVDIADGRMIQVNADRSQTLRIFQPSFSGYPFRELVRLTGSCFGGVTWLVRWPVSPPLRFQEGSTQMEDLMFMMAYSQPGRLYAHVDDTVLIYRRNSKSSTSDLLGMGRSYHFVHRWLREQGWAEPNDLRRFRWRSRRVMFASWLHMKRPLRAIISLFVPFT